MPLIGTGGGEGLGAPHAYLVALGAVAETEALLLAEQLRDRLPWLRLVMHCGGGGPKAQFKRADRSAATVALALGESEMARGVVGLKPLRVEGEQEEIRSDELPGVLAARLRGD